MVIHNESGGTFAMNQGTSAMNRGAFANESGDAILLKASTEAASQLPPVFIR